MSETTTLLKAGATGLVLRMAEAGTVMADLTLDNPVQAIGEVSRDMTGRSQVRLANGRAKSALGIQREYLAKARDFTGNRREQRSRRAVPSDEWDVPSSRGSGDQFRCHLGSFYDRRQERAVGPGEHGGTGRDGLAARSRRRWRTPDGSDPNR
jgi:hypothetical protein